MFNFIKSIFSKQEPVIKGSECSSACNVEKNSKPLKRTTVCSSEFTSFPQLTNWEKKLKSIGKNKWGQAIYRGTCTRCKNFKIGTLANFKSLKSCKVCSIKKIGKK
jgi:hypothetical protein